MAPGRSGFRRRCSGSAPRLARALLPRHFRIACLLVVSPFQAAIILTANYAFLNYIVLFLGVLLLDDRFSGGRLRRRRRPGNERRGQPASCSAGSPLPRGLWRRQERGLYAPTLYLGPEGIQAVAMPPE